MFLVHLLDGLALCQLKEGDLGRHHPAKQVAENRVITKWDDILKGGENVIKRSRNSIRISV